VGREKYSRRKLLSDFVTRAKGTTRTLREVSRRDEERETGPAERAEKSPQLFVKSPSIMRGRVRG